MGKPTTAPHTGPVSHAGPADGAAISRRSMIISTGLHAALVAVVWLLMIGPGPEQAPQPDEVSAAPIVRAPTPPPEHFDELTDQAQPTDELPAWSAQQLEPLALNAMPVSSSAKDASTSSGAGQAERGVTNARPQAMIQADQWWISTTESSDRQQHLGHEEAQFQNANHMFAGWLINHYREHWRSRYHLQCSGNTFITAVTVDRQQRVLGARIMDGSSSGSPELDSRIELLINELARSGTPWGLPPLPNSQRHVYRFAVTLP